MFALDAKWRSSEMSTARREVCQQETTADRAMNRPEDVVGRFFEEVGHYVLRGALPLRFVWAAYSYEVDHYWPMLKGPILRLRAETGDKSFFICFEKLQKRCRRYGRLRNPPWFRPLPVDPKRFREEETQRIDYYSSVRAASPTIILPSSPRGSTNVSAQPTGKA